MPSFPPELHLNTSLCSPGPSRSGSIPNLSGGIKRALQGVLAASALSVSAAELQRAYPPPSRPTIPLQSARIAPYRVPEIVIQEFVEDPHRLVSLDTGQLSSVTNADQYVEGRLSLPTGGQAVITSWKGPLDHAPRFISNTAGIVSDGNVTVLDCTLSSARVQRIAMRITSENDGELVPVRVLRGKTILCETNLPSGQNFQYTNEDGITAIVAQHSLKPLSSLYHEFMAWRQSPNGRGDEQYAWWHWSEYVRRIEDFDINGVMMGKFLFRWRDTPQEQARLGSILEPDVRTGQRSHRLILSDIQFNVLTSHTQPPVPQATPSTVGILAQAAAPRWGVPADFERVLRVLNENVYSDSHGNSPGEGTFRVLYRGGGGGNYRRFHARALFGGFTIKKVQYIGPGNVSDVPAPYCVLDNGDAILAPGCPEYLVFTLEKYGTPREYEVYITHSGNSLEDVEPVPGLRLELKIQGMYHGRAPEDAQFSFLEDRSVGVDAIAGREIYALIRLDNSGSGSGRVILKAYVGYTGTSRDILIGSKEVNIGSMSLAGTVFNFTVPGGGSGGLPMVTFVAELPDGTRIDYPRTMNQAWYGTDASGRGRSANAPKTDETTQRRFDHAQSLAAGAISLGNDARLTAWYGSKRGAGTQLGSSPTPNPPPVPPTPTNRVDIVPPLQSSFTNVLNQVSTINTLSPFSSTEAALEYAVRSFLEFNEIMIRAQLRQLFFDFGIFGNSDDYFEYMQRDAYILAYGDSSVTGTATDAKIAGVVFREMWEASTEHTSLSGSALENSDTWLPSSLSPNLPFFVDTSTLFGRATAGLLGDLRTLSQEAFRARIAVISHITGIGEGEMEFFFRIVRNSPDSMTRIKQFFIQKGFGSIFESSATTIGPENPIVSLHLSGDTFRSQQDTLLRATFDIAPNLKNFHHAHIYLIDADTGQQIDASSPLTAEICDQLFADIPVATIIEQLRRRSLSPALFNFKLKLVIWPTETGSGIAKESSRASIELDWGTKIDPRTLMDGTVWQSLSEERRRALREDLDFGDLARLPVGNKAIMEKLIDEQLKKGTLKYQVDSVVPGYVFEGSLGGTGTQQCKEWLQQSVIAPATGVTVPGNLVKDVVIDDVTYSLAGGWNMQPTNDEGKILSADGRVEQILRVTNPSSIPFAFSGGLVKKGDVIQMIYGKIQHTMVIGKITENGIWVFDTNWEYKRHVPTEIGSGTHYKNGERHIEAKTDEEKAIANFTQVDDNTVRFHFLKSDSLQNSISEMTVYRVNQ